MQTRDTAGYDSPHCLQVAKAAGCTAYKMLASGSVSAFESKMCVYRGYYPSPLPLRAGAYAVTASGDVGVGSCFLPAVNDWAPFELYFDMRNVAAGSTSAIEYRFSTESGAVTVFYIDDETVQTMY
jgi:hypothetical protein